jgi:hypothetical protein
MMAAKKRAREREFVFHTLINSYHYLYQDAEYLRSMASLPEMVGRFERVRICRTAIILYVLSLEGLINRAMDHFLPPPLRDFYLEREEKLSLEDKWLLLPLLVSKGHTAHFVRSRYPWSHFTELVRLRNEFVHPKHDRPAYYRVKRSHEWEPLEYKKLPKDMGVPEANVVYRQTQIPRDPYALKPTHLETAKRVTDDVITELDRLLDGKIKADDWLTNDSMQLVYPPGATFADLPRSDVISRAI